MRAGVRRCPPAQAGVLADQAALAAWAARPAGGSGPMVAAAAQLHLAAARRGVRLELRALAAGFFVDASRVKLASAAHRRALVAAAAQARPVASSSVITSSCKLGIGEVGAVAREPAARAAGPCARPGAAKARARAPALWAAASVLLAVPAAVRAPWRLGTEAACKSCRRRRRREDMPCAFLHGNRDARWGRRRAADALRAQAPWLCGVTGRTVLQHWDTVLRLAPPDALPPPAAGAAAAAAAAAAPPAAPPAVAGEAPESPGGVPALGPTGGAPPADPSPAGAARTAAGKRVREEGPPAGAGAAAGAAGGRDSGGLGRRGGRAARVGARSAAEEAVLSSDSDLDEYIRPPAEVACLRMLGL